ncbi:DUF2922 domain-containing protein [Jeotgalibaca sp. A127]|uniref:DUF2922 domain-containing protein n=1 Tax=Jeotgalibaca sp. A127 TaxID=3457324 RepID=UPI003FD13B81
MEKTLTLELKFKASDGKSKNLTLRNPSEGLTAAEIQPAMATIVGLDVFSIEGVNPYSAVDSARYIEKIITEIL